MRYLIGILAFGGFIIQALTLINIAASDGIGWAIAAVFFTPSLIVLPLFYGYAIPWLLVGGALFALGAADRD